MPRREEDEEEEDEEEEDEKEEGKRKGRREKVHVGEEERDCKTRKVFKSNYSTNAQSMLPGSKWG